MGNKLSALNVIAPEPINEVIIHTGNCFICLETCEQLYDTQCNCIVYCHSVCDRRYRSWATSYPRVNRMHNCPMCRSAVYDDNNDNELGIVSTCYLIISVKFIQLLLIIFLATVVPFCVGLVAVFVLSFDKINEMGIILFIDNNLFSIWIIGCFISVILTSVYMIIKTCSYCCRSLDE